MNIEDLKRRSGDPEKGVHHIAEIRNGLIEGLHKAHIAVVNNKGELLFSSGDPELITYSRSCIKPIQTLPVLISGAADHYGLTEKEIAIISGSHSGQDEHLETVRSILKKAGLEESYLECRGHVPFDKETAKKVAQDFTPLHDNCSGKHSGALLLCKYMGWDLESYLDVDHPIQKSIVDIICELTGLARKDVHIGIDGCDIPNHAIPIRNMAHLFALLGNADGMKEKQKIERVGRAMVQHPFMVAGSKRFDTVIMEDNPGTIISKAGAAGLQSLAVKREDEWIGIALKIEDGAYSAIPPLTYHVLEEMGCGVDMSQKGREYAEGRIKTRSKKVVGRTEVTGKLKNHQ